VLAGAFAAALVAPLPASACTVLDLTCASNAIGGTAPGTVQDTGAAAGDALGSGVDDTVGSASGTIDDTVGSASGAVDDVASTVDDNLDDVLSEGSSPTDPGTDPTGPMPTDQDHPRARDRDERALGRAGVPADVVSADRRPSVAPVAPAPSLAPASASASRSPARDSFGNMIAAAAPSLVVLAALLGLVTAFVFVQSWMDRRDPRLLAAPPADEMAWFR
jgi:hypothetical protein